MKLTVEAVFGARASCPPACGQDARAPYIESAEQPTIDSANEFYDEDDTTEISTDRQLQENYNLEEWADGIRISWM